MMKRHAQIKVPRRALSARIALEFNGLNFIEADKYRGLVNEDELFFEGIQMSFIGSVLSTERKHDIVEQGSHIIWIQMRNRGMHPRHSPQRTFHTGLLIRIGELPWDEYLFLRDDLERLGHEIGERTVHMRLNVTVVFLFKRCVIKVDI